MKKHKNILIVLGTLSLLCFVIFKPFLVFKNAYYFWDICSDGFYYCYPQICFIADYFKHYGFPGWSFGMGMGQNILPFTFRDPFDVLLYCIGSKYVLYATIYIEVIKIILSGLVFYKYLRLLNFSFYTSYIGCLLFAFCGFITVGSAWFCFTFEAFNFALLLLGFELYFIKQKWILFSFAIFLYCISMPFNLYLYGLFLISYIIFRHVQTGQFNFKQLFISFLRLSLFTLIGILISAPLFVQNLLLILNSPRGSQTQLTNQFSELHFYEISDPMQLGTAIMRFFSNDILGSSSNFKGWDTILGAPLFYIGLICLLIMPQLFTFLKRRLKYFYIIYILVWLLPVVFPYFRRAIWLFTGDYYRGYGFFVAFILLHYTLIGLDQILEKRKVNLILLLTSLGIFLTLLYFPLFIDNKIIDGMIRTFVSVMLVLYTTVIFFIGRQSSNSKFAPPNIKILKYILFFFILVEIGFSGYMTVIRREAFKMKWLTNDKVMYNSYSQDAVNYLQQVDNSFYRIDKNYDPPTARYTDLNASQKQGYKGTTSYNSFNNCNYINYLILTGVINKNNEAESRWSIGLYENPILETENRVKYFLSVKDYHPVWNEMWDSVATIGDVKIYRNKLTLPFGYTCNKYILDSNFYKASPLQRKFITLNTVVVNKKDLNLLKNLKELPLEDTIKGSLNYNTFCNAINQTYRDSLFGIQFGEDHLFGKIKIADSEMVYLTIPYDEGWQLKVDGKKYEKTKIDGGLIGVLLSKGLHTIEMHYKLLYFNEGMILCALGIMFMFVFNSSQLKKMIFSKKQELK